MEKSLNKCSLLQYKSAKAKTLKIYTTKKKIGDQIDRRL